jgi:hypothetical protein
MFNKIIVLGMHRSGTSWLAGSLEAAGVDLGEVSNFNKFNKRGNKENDAIMKMHDDLLLKNNCNWFNCRKELKYRARDQKFLKEFFSKEKIKSKDKKCFKDPRSIIFFNNIYNLFNRRITPIGIFRDPIKCANSIVSRDKFDLQDALDCWYFYNSLLLKYSKKYNFALINFDEFELKFFILDKFCIENSICFEQEFYKFEDKKLFNQKNKSFEEKLDNKYNDLYFELIDQSIKMYKN